MYIFYVSIIILVFRSNMVFHGYYIHFEWNVSEGDGAVSNSVISSVFFCTIPRFCIATKWHSVLLEIFWLVSSDGSSSPSSFNQSSNLTKLILGKTFKIGYLFSYLWVWVSGIISLAHIFHDFVTSTKYFSQYKLSCVALIHTRLLHH